MARKQDVLGQLVELKRQRAEQRLAAAQAAVDHAQNRIEKLQGDLTSLDREDVNLEDLILARVQGRVEALMTGIAQEQAGLPKLHEEVLLAREALKKALFSKDQLQQS